MMQFLIAIDQLINTLIGSGFADETLSAWAQRRGGWRKRVINGIFFWQDDHCYQSYLSEKLRKQLPPEYRT